MALLAHRRSARIAAAIAETSTTIIAQDDAAIQLSRVASTNISAVVNGRGERPCSKCQRASASMAFRFRDTPYGQ
jgi:hypothetical protein